MKVSDVMTRDVRVASPDQSIRDAARMMVELDAGALPVGEHDRLAEACRGAVRSSSRRRR